MSLTRMRSETVMKNLLKFSRLRRWRAPIEPFGEGHGLLIVIANRSVERVNLHIVLANHELEFQDSAGAQPRFRGVHDRAAKALMAPIRIYCDVVDPAAMAIMADHHRSHDHVAVTAGQHGRIRTSPRQRNIGGGIVPRPRRAAALPKCDDDLDIGVCDVGDSKCCSGHGRVHSTLPGFMMPSGSSNALNDRISEIATLSLTSGSSSRLSTPMPCSAEIDPPIRITIANTTALTSCQRSRKSVGSAPTGWLTL